MTNIDASQEGIGVGAAVTPSSSAFAPRPADRTAIAVVVSIVWIGILSGFGADSFFHVQRFGLDYPLIVHVHAIVFFAWLVVFTAQIRFVRASRIDLHQKLGGAAVGLALVMLVLGPLTAISVAARHYASDGEPPVFLAIELATLVAFAGLTLAALLLRRTPAAHKRLMLLGLIFLSTPGFARFLNVLVAQLHFGISPLVVQIYFFTDFLILAMGAYDLIVRHRLHPAYVAGAVGCFGIQAIALTLLSDPGWAAFSLHLIGH